MDKWYNITTRTTLTCIGYIAFRWLFLSTVLSYVAYLRWNDDFLGITNTFWDVVLTIWAFFSSEIVFRSYGYFQPLCAYFRIRFRKVP